MRASRSACLLLGGLLAVAAGGTRADPSVFDGVSQETLASLDADGLVMLARGDGEGEWISALVVFEHPADRVMALLTATDRQAEYRKDVSSIETVDRGDAYAVDEHRLRIMFVRIHYRLHTDWDLEAGQVTWRLDPSFENDLRSVEGSWRVENLDDGRSAGLFRTKVDVGPALPTFLQSGMTERNVKQTIPRIRRWVNENAAAAR